MVWGLGNNINWTIKSSKEKPKTDWWEKRHYVQTKGAHRDTTTKLGGQ